MNLYIAYVDFVKAFDRVNHDLLSIILGKLGCPSKFIRIIRKLYTDVSARLIVDGELTQSFQYYSGVKQGCKLALTLFGMYAAVLLLLAFKDIAHKFSVPISADGVFLELLVHGGRCLWTFLLTLLNIVWAKEIIPTDWIDTIITILFNKGDRSDCGNYRGISLLSAVGKVFADVVLQRLHCLQSASMRNPSRVSVKVEVP